MFLRGENVMEFRQLRHRRRCISVAVAFALFGSFAATAQPSTPDGGELAASATANGGSAQGAASATDPAAQQGTNQPSSSSRSAPINLGTVMVTANKREERLQVVPMAVSALSGDDLRRQGANSFADYASQIPGLNLISTSVGQTQLVLR